MNPFEEFWKPEKNKRPIIHFITNYVTVNDCANIALALGASPIMADDVREVEQMVELCSALVINIGTLNERTIPAMLTAGKHANKLNRPILIDPVGIGSSKLRNEVVEMLLRELNFTVIKGNITEMKYLYDGMLSTKGIDADIHDLVTENNLAESIQFAQRLSLMMGAVIVITGPIDIVASSYSAYAIRNGHPLMAEITGTGCMAGAAIASYLGMQPQRAMEACAAAMSAMGVCGELAFDRLQSMSGGNGTYRTLIIDCMSRLSTRMLSDRIRIEHIVAGDREET